MPRKTTTPSSRGVWDQSSKRATWRNRQPSQPFFHCLTFTASHEGSLHFGEEALNKQKTVNDPNYVALPPHFPDTPLFRYTTARYLDRIQKVDELIGGVIAKLKQDELLESTFVFFFGDHGGVLPRSKGYLFETGLHVPLVIHVPKKYSHLVKKDLRTGIRTSRFVSFVDFGPTVLKLAGVSDGDQLDGKPFFGTGSIKKSNADTNIAFGYADRFDEKIDLVRSVRKGRHKYIRNFQPHYPDAMQNNYRYRMLAYQQWRSLFKAGKLNRIQSQFFSQKPAEALFDIQADPFETTNIATDSSQRVVLIELRGLLSNWMSEMPDTGLLPEHVLIEQAFDSPIEFGTRNKQRVARLLETANLALDFPESAILKLDSALDSQDPWQRYWAIQTSTSIGEQAQLQSLTDKIRRLAADDAEPLNRVASTEYLAIHTDDDVQPIFDSGIRHSKNQVELASILNSVVVLRDHYEKPIKLDASWFTKPKPRSKENVDRRLSYLLNVQK